MKAASARHVTIADVARLAEVNASTVSRVLNGRASVKPETRHRIEHAVSSLGYRPSQLAQSLASSKTWTLGVLLPDIQNLMHVEFLRGVQHAVQERGYSLVISDGQLNADVQSATLDRFLKMRIDGIIVSRAFSLPALLEPFSQAGVPFEPLEVLQPSPEDIEERRTGSFGAFRHVFGLGHTTAALFVHERDDAPGRSPEMRARIAALLHVRDEFGPERPVVHLAPVRREADVHEQLGQLLVHPQRPTVLIAGNDWMTAPLLAAARDAGLRIPEDMSFLTYGDSRWAAAYRPPISAIRYDYYAEGQTLATRVLRRLGEPVDDVIADRPLADDEFVDRASLGPPPGRATRN